MPEMKVSQLMGLIVLAVVKSGRSEEGVLRLCPHSIRLDTAPGSDSPHRNRFAESVRGLLSFRTWQNAYLDLTDAGTTRALVTLLALVRGHDPGELGLSVAWMPLMCGLDAEAPYRRGWYLGNQDTVTYYVPEIREGYAVGDGSEVEAPEVARENSAINALVRACLMEF